MSPQKKPHRYQETQGKFLGNVPERKQARWAAIRRSIIGANGIPDYTLTKASRLWKFFQNGPGDIVLEILYYLDPKSLISLALSRPELEDMLMDMAPTIQQVWRAARQSVGLLASPMPGFMETEWICLLAANGDCEICGHGAPNTLDLYHKLWICDYCIFTYKKTLKKKYPEAQHDILDVLYARRSQRPTHTPLSRPYFYLHEDVKQILHETQDLTPHEREGYMAQKHAEYETFTSYNKWYSNHVADTRLLFK
ncbi:hypothetical protein V5O48_004503 [Marasmius crinis-equi]|uniref:F-box domain-containing protein n=1 Tax=Marasmius crinis-equi TaxID=585013 RepID=A0ABR3FPV3_9AGAR